MRLDLGQTAGTLRVHPRVRGTPVPGLIQAWNRSLSAPAFACFMHDLELFGRFAWHCDDVLRTCVSILEAIANGVDALDALACAWDDEQAACGLAWATRVRRRTTLRAFVRLASDHGAAPRGISLDVLALPTLDRRSIASCVESAIVSTTGRGMWRDASVLTLFWDGGRTVLDVQSLRVGDLPLSDVSDRCAHALSRHARTRPEQAWLFAARSRSRPLTLNAFTKILAVYGLPTWRSIRRARKLRLAELGHPFDEARALAGE